MIDYIGFFPCLNSKCGAVVKPLSRSSDDGPRDVRVECPECGAGYDVTVRPDRTIRVKKIYFPPPIA
jgi:hypothetical protein